MRLKGVKVDIIVVTYMEENEEWLKIEDFENYEVSNLGKVRNTKTGRILKINHLLIILMELKQIIVLKI